MLSLANIYTLYFRLYFRLCICLNKLSINQSTTTTTTDITTVNHLLDYSLLNST